MNEPTEFREWCIVELFGHRRIAGLVTEQQISGEAFVRVDVPGDAPRSSLYGKGAIYAMHVTTEDLARAAAGSLTSAAPLDAYDIRRLGFERAGMDVVDGDGEGPF